MRSAAVQDRAMFVKRRPVFDGAFVDPMDQAVRIARSEYLGFLATHGLDDVELRRKAELTSNQMPMPYGFDHVEIRPSPIEGLGMFATDDIEPWQLIAPARIDGQANRHCRWPHPGAAQAQLRAPFDPRIRHCRSAR
ncbi:SET domain-containing protein [Variovorax sp. LG9.2]|uniref:SET domain-containing protein n=1 Tax=Variovorax sp. LG9.2 TaxID=3048626 RepID=UPI002B23D6F9|nr:SET domain-containing protein [Variovorax sp. LG9.2]MEB0058805.1 SET domain-containing protein [Variovorax sp. LG9.2]